MMVVRQRTLVTTLFEANLSLKHKAISLPWEVGPMSYIFGKPNVSILETCFSRLRPAELPSVPEAKLTKVEEVRSLAFSRAVRRARRMRLREAAVGLWPNT